MRSEAEVMSELKGIGADVPAPIIGCLAQELLPEEVIIDGVAAEGLASWFASSVTLLAWSSQRVFSVEWGREFGREYTGLSHAYWANVNDAAILGDSTMTGVFVKGPGATVLAYFKHAPVADERVRACYEKIQQRVAALKAEMPAAMSDAGPALVDQLERLAALKSKGDISEEEFQLAKRKLLSG